ncbi:uncharacterized protein LOC114156961 [Xiphophorus couchianus]|uniref:uncharacterized protein LOC114156961 n=1 Tax=Xiphophorus couchianus TaxID=32473 RepID=UPI001015E08A|nr:uncharacterized protein LOC114156961 [Xiphophorus couchianus]
MPRKERRQKQKRKELIDAAKGSGLLTDWVRTSTADGQKESDRSEEETKMQSTTQEDRQGEGQQSEINTMDENAEQQVREKPFIFLMDLPHPNDPAHVLQFNIKYDEAFIQNCVNQGPCQPELSFPKNEEGRSFQNKWYKSNPWLEYSPSLNSMFCFSCRVFLNEENWTNATVPPKALQALKMLCQFYEIDDQEKLKTELKVFHNSYLEFSSYSVSSMLSVIKENNADLVFPNLTGLLKTYATLPVSTATVERSFSKLKLMKTKLRSLCKEDRLSDLLLLAIEKDVPIIHSEVIDIFRDMTNRKLLL